MRPPAPNPPLPKSYTGLHFSLNKVVLAGMKPCTTMKCSPLGAHCTSWIGPSFRSGTWHSRDPSVRMKCRFCSP